MAEMIATARTFVELPAPRPMSGGAMTVANVIDTSGHELMGVEALSDACATAEEWDEWCTTTPLGRKIFDDALDHVVGDPFAVYAGVACDLQRTDEAAERARRRLDYTESRSVDAHLDAYLASDPSVVDLGGPFPFPQAVGAAEAFVATVYGGAPTLLIPRQYLQCGCTNGGMRTNLDGTLETCGGSRVATLTAPVPVPVTFTQGTIYVSGSLTLYRGPVQVISVPQQVFDDGTFAPARALAERIYVPVFDCLVAKVDVTCS